MWLLNPYRFAAAYTPTDVDAAAYIAAVEAADGQTLEAGVRQSIDAFVIGCKSGGIWTAIKASCILAGARTLAGALVPLAGTAPTRFGTEAGWNYNRKTGLRANGTDNYLNSNRNNNADPQNSVHQAIWMSTAPSTGTARISIGAGVTDSGATHIVRNTPGAFGSRNRNGVENAPVLAPTVVTGFAGHSRATSSDYTLRANGTNYNAGVASQVPYTGNVFVFATNPASFYSDARLAFYSIGESLNLALLDARVTTLINAISAAIP